MVHGCSHAPYRWFWFYSSFVVILKWYFMKWFLFTLPSLIIQLSTLINGVVKQISSNYLKYSLKSVFIRFYCLCSFGMCVCVCVYRTRYWISICVFWIMNTCLFIYFLFFISLSPTFALFEWMEVCVTKECMVALPSANIIK